MRFLFRMAFWLGVVLVLLPSTGSAPAPKVQLSAGDAVSAATAAVGDMRRFCERQPDACVVGSQTAAAIGQRAQAGAKILYEFLNEQFGPQATGTVPGTATGKGIPLPPAKPSQHTLTSTDLTPAWRDPHPSRNSSGEN